MTYIRYPSSGSGSSGIPTYASFASLPVTAADGAAAITLDTDSLYIFNAGSSTWLLAASTAGMALTNSHIFVGNASNIAADKAMSGDGQMANTGALTILTVGGSTAADIHNGELLANAATAANTASAIVKRDGSGNFIAGTITANLTGNASGTSANITGNLAVANLNSGTGATSTTFWRGDGTWGTPAGTLPSIGGTITSGTDGSVLFVHAAGLINQDNLNFSYSATTHKLTLTNFPIISSSATAGPVQADGAGNLTVAALVLNTAGNVSGILPTVNGGLGVAANAGITANTFFAAPSGSSGAGSFRAIVGADLPNPSSTTLGGVRSVVATTSQWVNTISTSGVPTTTQPAFSDISGSPTYAQIATNLKVPTVQRFATAGSFTYTLPTSPSPLYIIVEVQGGGGGGGGSGLTGSTAGNDGATSSFGTSFITCSAGLKGSVGQVGGGAGGTVTIGTGPIIMHSVTGGAGGAGAGGATGIASSGGIGGSSFFGGQGAGGAPGGLGGAANGWGSGGGGGGSAVTTTIDSSSAGGAGAYAKCLVTSSLASTYAVVVGDGGGGGNSGTSGFSGGAGLRGTVVVFEAYQ